MFNWPLYDLDKQIRPSRNKIIYVSVYVQLWLTALN